jgi:hypothetical protein
MDTPQCIHTSTATWRSSTFLTHLCSWAMEQHLPVCQQKDVIKHFKHLRTDILTSSGARTMCTDSTASQHMLPNAMFQLQYAHEQCKRASGAGCSKATSIVAFRMWQKLARILTTDRVVLESWNTRTVAGCQWQHNTSEGRSVLDTRSWCVSRGAHQPSADLIGKQDLFRPAQQAYCRQAGLPV